MTFSPFLTLMTQARYVMFRDSSPLPGSVGRTLLRGLCRISDDLTRREQYRPLSETLTRPLSGPSCQTLKLSSTRIEWEADRTPDSSREGWREMYPATSFRSARQSPRPFEHLPYLKLPTSPVVDWKARRARGPRMRVLIINSRLI